MPVPRLSAWILFAVAAMSIPNSGQAASWIPETHQVRQVFSVEMSSQSAKHAGPVSAISITAPAVVNATEGDTVSIVATAGSGDPHSNLAINVSGAPPGLTLATTGILPRFGTLSGVLGPQTAGTWLLFWSVSDQFGAYDSMTTQLIVEAPTSTSVALQEAGAEAGLARLRWNVPDSRGIWDVQRRVPGGDWLEVGVASLEGPGVVLYEDRSVVPGARYAYRLRNGSDYSSEVWVLVPSAKEAPLSLRLDRIFPNPFQTQTTLSFGIPSAAVIKLRVYSAAGRLVATVVDGRLPAGWRSVNWDGRDSSGRPVATGTYFARLDAAGAREVRKVVVIR